MTERPSEIALFGFGIRILKNTEGRRVYETRAENSGVPIEIVIMKMRAYLSKLEKDYFDDFEKTSASYREE